MGSDQGRSFFKESKMLEYMDVHELALAAVFGAWALVFFAFAGFDSLHKQWQLRRKVKCPACTSEATQRTQLCDTTRVWCKECGLTHSLHAGEKSWMRH